MIYVNIQQKNQIIENTSSYYDSELYYCTLQSELLCLKSKHFELMRNKLYFDFYTISKSIKRVKRKIATLY